MTKLVGFIKGIPGRLKNQLKNLFTSKKHNKISEGAAEVYKSHPHKARGDNWRRPDEHNKSANHHNQPPKHHKG